MGTNASCRCLDNRLTAQRFGYGMRGFVEAVRKAIEQGKGGTSQ